MKLVFLSGLYSEELRKRLNYVNPQFVQNAPNSFQWNIVEGLVENNVDFEIVSYPFIPCYPTYPYCSINAESILYKGVQYGNIMKYSTIPLIKDLSIMKSLNKYIENLVALYSNEELLFLVYAPYSFFLLPIINQKRKFKNIKINVIITDLIDNAYNYKENSAFLKRFQIMRESFLERKCYKHIDKFILLSESMVERIPEAIGKSILLEGISPMLEYHKKEKSSIIKKILYTGTLELFSGVRNLIQAFENISNENYRLIICGSGPLEKEINEAAKKDSRILFKGIVSREEAVNLQQEATLLINPRMPDNNITKYSFPSKTMEYMVSGTPMMGYKLEGIPEEYYKYYYVLEKCNIDYLAVSMEKILELSQEELDIKAYDAYKFIMKQKTAKKQIKRVLDFLK